MKNGLLYRKQQEMKAGRSSNQLVVPKGIRQPAMSVNHEPAFSGHLGAQETEVRIEVRTSFGQDYARTLLDSAVPVMCANERYQ